MKALLVALLPIAVNCTQTAVIASPFAWGVNGHPGVQEGYCQIPIEQQLDLVAQLGAKWYRCDWYQGAVEKSPVAYDKLVEEAEQRGLRLLPIIFPTTGCRSDASTEQIRQESFEFARKLVGHFKGRITHWELDNELDNLTMVRKGEKCRDGSLWQWGDPDGDKPVHFEETRYQKAKAELLGLHEGVKAADPKALTIVDSAGWLHYGFFERLVREDKVPFDLLGWHWYSEMGDMTKVRGTFNLLKHLTSYGRPIWVTELNRRGGSQGGHEEDQSNFLRAIAIQLRQYPVVEAFFVYELLDEPYFGADNAESHYGLVEVVKGLDGRWRVGRQKKAFHGIQSLLAGSDTTKPSPGKAARYARTTSATNPLHATIDPRQVSSVIGNPFGTQTTSMGEGHEAARLETFLKEISDCGYGWVKDYFGAGNVAEGEDWKKMWLSFPPHYEEFLRTATDLKLKVMLRLDYPRFHGQEPTSPEGLQVVAQFYRQAVRQLKPWVHDWEIDNEPNIGNEKPRLTPEDYTRIVEAAAKAIRSEDPKALVYAPASAMLQCLHTSPYPYIPRLLDAGLLNHIDVFSFHPYRQPYQRVNVPEHASEFHPWQVWGSYQKQLADLRTRLRGKAGKDVPLAATEVGYPTHRDKQTEVQEISLTTQAKYEQRMMIQDFALGVRPRINFIFKRPWSDPYEVEHQFSLVNADGSKRPAYFAVQNVCAVFGDSLKPSKVKVTCDAPPEAANSASSNVQVYAFEKKSGGLGELIVALWAGVPAVDAAYSSGSCRVTIHSNRYEAPVSYDLMQPTPISGRALTYRTAGRSAIIEGAPLQDSPVVVKVLARQDRK
ncbi:MAG: hypothetical protein HY318_18915 [Armatimonadetes bacterium]|nr:hypothetical protein [Armatimonadota bacterium]